MRLSGSSSGFYILRIRGFVFYNPIDPVGLARGLGFDPVCLARGLGFRVLGRFKAWGWGGYRTCVGFVSAVLIES